MAISINLDDIEDYLDKPIPTNRAANVKAWLSAISSSLSFRYLLGIMDDTNSPVVFDIVANAISRRLTRTTFDPRVRGQSVQGATVSLAPGTYAYFYPEEIAQLDVVLGPGGNVGTVRTPAPDAIRFANVAQGDYYEDIENELPWV